MFLDIGKGSVGGALEETVTDIRVSYDVVHQLSNCQLFKASRAALNSLVISYGAVHAYFLMKCILLCLCTIYYFYSVKTQQPLSYIFISVLHVYERTSHYRTLHPAQPTAKIGRQNPLQHFIQDNH
jgi:hypothetical protein